jgi:hypothetical protein
VQARSDLVKILGLGASALLLAACGNDHTEHDLDPPVDHGDIRYQHHNEWRAGADGPMALPSQATAADSVSMGAVELRFLASGVTSIVGIGGTEGLARNLGSTVDPVQLRGLSGNPATFDTLPLGDENGTILTSGCKYPTWTRRRTRSRTDGSRPTSARASTSAPRTRSSAPTSWSPSRTRSSPAAGRRLRTSPPCACDAKPLDSSAH